MYLYKLSQLGRMPQTPNNLRGLGFKMGHLEAQSLRMYRQMSRNLIVQQTSLFPRKEVGAKISCIIANFYILQDDHKIKLLNVNMNINK